MDSNEINVTKTEQVAIYRQTIVPESQDKTVIEETIASTYRALSEGKATAKIMVSMTMGGVRNITTEQVAKISPGSEADRILDDEFSK